MKNIGILLAAGRGSRMGSDKKKQFMELQGRPLMCLSLEAMERSSVIDGIIVVTGRDDLKYVRDSILAPRAYKKIIDLIPGGELRCLSVLNGIKACPREAEYVFIQDGARPFLSEDILQRNLEAVRLTGGCVTALPSQDTVRLSGACNGGLTGAAVVHSGDSPLPFGSTTDPGLPLCGQTLDRNLVWLMQTPQTFRLDLARAAFDRLQGRPADELSSVTDDVMVLQETFPELPISLVMGSKSNIKVTTPEDLPLAEFILSQLPHNPAGSC